MSPFKGKTHSFVCLHLKICICVLYVQVLVRLGMYMCSSPACSSSDSTGHSDAVDWLFITQMEFYSHSSESYRIWKLFKSIHCSYKPCGNFSCEIHIYSVTSLLIGNSKALTSCIPADWLFSTPASDQQGKPACPKGKPGGECCPSPPNTTPSIGRKGRISRQRRNYVAALIQLTNSKKR